MSWKYYCLANCILFSVLADGVRAEEHDHAHHTTIEPGESASDSLFLTDSVWTTSEGKAMRLADLKGEPAVLSLFYASCESACPAIVEAMKKLERALPSAKLGFVLVTFDPENDSADVLQKYASKRSLAKEKWRLLRGSEADTRELAVLLGSKYKRTGEKQFAHSNLIVLLDGEGRVVARAQDLSEIDKLTEQTRRLLESTKD